MFKYTISQLEMPKITVLIKQRKCFLIVQLEIVEILFGILWTKLQNVTNTMKTLSKSTEISFTLWIQMILIWDMSCLFLPVCRGYCLYILLKPLLRISLHQAFLDMIWCYDRMIWFWSAEQTAFLAFTQISWVPSYFKSTFYQLRNRFWCRWQSGHHLFENSIFQIPPKILRCWYFRIGNNVIIPYHSLIMSSGDSRYSSALVGGMCSAWACFCLNNHHLASATFFNFVSGMYGLHTQASSAAIVDSSIDSVASSCVSASTIGSSLSTCSNSFQQVVLPLPPNFPVISAPVRAWKPGSAAALAGPRASYIGLMGTSFWFRPVRT